MAEITTLAVEPRNETGSRLCRQLRKQGRVPGNMYGMGQEVVAISAATDELESMVLAGIQVVQITDNDADSLAMFRELQWNTFGTHLHHFDLLRIDADKKVEIEITVEIRGIASGTLAGGVLDLQCRSLPVRCAAHQIPPSILVRIGQLEIGQGILVGDLAAIDGVEFLTPPESVVVQVNAPIVMDDEDDLDAISTAAEPEVIGRDTEGKDDE
ncbi:MAG: 50S ribosomal protein L25 [Planctomycetaceae bacterium]